MVVVHRIFMELCSFQRWDVNIPGAEVLKACLCSVRCYSRFTSFVEDKLYSRYYIYILRSFCAYAFEYC